MSKREIHEQEHNPDEQVNVQESPADTPEMEENLPDPEAEADGEDEALTWTDPMRTRHSMRTTFMMRKRTLMMRTIPYI